MRTHFQKVRPKGKQCAMTGALFSKKCARGYFSAPFAQWRSPNASLQDGQFLLKLTLEIMNYFANKQDHVMKKKQINILHHHSLLSEDIS